MCRGKLVSTELFTILGGFTSSLVFLFLLMFIGNYQESSGVKTGWGTVILAEAVARCCWHSASSVYNDLLLVLSRIIV